MAADRITELYEGAIENRVAQQAARRRIHWMCRQATGAEVLDVGCSQGIASILLGREGKRVVGLERSPPALEFAQERLNLEEPAVRQRVKFVEAEAVRMPLEDEAFDSVLMGEFLAEQVDHETSISEATRVLRPGGRLVVTTLYGPLEPDDLDEPLYLGSLLELLDEQFSVREIDVIDRHLGLAATKKRPKAGARARARLAALRIAEHRLARQDETVQHQRRSIDALEAERDRWLELEASGRASEAELTRSREEIAELRSRLQEVTESTPALQADLARAEAERDALVREVARQGDQLLTAARERREAEATERKRVDQLTTELKTATDELTELRSGHEVLQDALAAKRSEAVGLRDALDAVRSELGTVVADRMQARETLERLEAEQRTAAGEVERLTREHKVAAKQRDAALAERDSATSARDAALAERDEAEVQLSAEADRRERSEAAILGHQARTASLLAELDEAKRGLESTTEAARGLREQLETATARVTELESLVDQLETTTTLREEQVAASERDFRSASERLAQLELREEELARELASRDATIAELETGRQALDERVTELERTGTEREGDLRKLRDQLATEAHGRAQLTSKLLIAQARLADRAEAMWQLRSGRAYRMAVATWRARKRAVLLAPLALLVIAAGAAAAAGMGPVELSVPVAILAVAGVLVVGLGIVVFTQFPAPPSKPKPEEPVGRSFVLPLQPPVALPSETAPPPATPAPPLSQRVAARTGVDAERERWVARSRSLIRTADLRVATILDEMSEKSYAPDCKLAPVPADEAEWRAQLEAEPPDLLLVESAWAGNAGGWQYMVGSYPHPHYAGLPQLRGLLDWCNARDVPAVFWNKEDPVHFERFQEAAKLFDVVFTSDSNCIPRYQALRGRAGDDVHALPFAAQPALHNPITVVGERSPQPVFAGTFYRDRHATRQGSLEMLLDAAREFDLIVYDRRLGEQGDSYGFPDRFKEHIAGRLPYERVVESYKSHKVYLNTNSVSDSPTMFSRRVFELLACETAVVSTESVGMEAIFGDLVRVVRTPEEATQALRRLLGDEDHRRSVTHAARRLIMSRHTYRERLAAIGRSLGLPMADDGAEAAVIVVLDDSDADALPALLLAIAEQSATPSEIIIGASAELDAGRALGEAGERLPDTRVRMVRQEPVQSRSERYRELANLSVAELVAVMHPGHTYRNDHLIDLLGATRFADADVIGSAPQGAAEHQYVEAVHPHSAIARREVLTTGGWQDDPATTELRARFRAGIRFYALPRDTFAPHAEPS